MPNKRGAGLCAIASCTLAFSWITVLTRCWVRLSIVKLFGLDDWLMVVALVRNPLHFLRLWSHIHSFYSHGSVFAPSGQAYMAADVIYLTSHLSML